VIGLSGKIRCDALLNRADAAMYRDKAVQRAQSVM
jgi:hypothetical protein